MGKQKKIFEYAHQVKPFLVKVKHVVAWVDENHERFGIDHKVHDSTISRALNGIPVYPGVVDALIELHRIATDDPWSMCEPPAFEDLAEYASLKWWHNVLEPDVPLNTWNMLKSRPLAPEREVAVREAFDDWCRRLRTACDDHKRNTALTQAFVADVEPQVVEWVLVDGVVHRKTPGVYGPTFKFVRAQPFGLHQWCYLSDVKTEKHFVQEAALARALSVIEQPLPDVARASLGYDVTVTDEDVEWAEEMVARMLQSGFAEAVGRAWNGESWEFILTRKEDRQERWRYVWDDAAWDYREEVVDAVHKIWEKRRHTGRFVAAHFEEPPEDNRFWIEPRVDVTQERDFPGGPWRDVKQWSEGYWAFTPTGGRRPVNAAWVDGEWVEGFFRDPTDEEREFLLTGLRRIVVAQEAELKASWMTSARNYDKNRVIADARVKRLVDNGDGTTTLVTGYTPRTDAQLEAQWLKAKDELMADRAREAEERDQVIADRMAALNKGQPD